MPILNWLGRDEALKTAAKTPYRLLEEVPELGYGDKSADNMIVQGDNLEALKALLPFYAGQVKCIYIDPPFNTKSMQNIYYDDNIENSKWLSIMFPRLELLHEFLAENGVIFVHLNMIQISYMQVMLDEIFGRNNFLQKITVKAASTASFRAINLCPVTISEYILMYAKNKTYYQRNMQYVESDYSEDYGYIIENFEQSPDKWKLSKLCDIIYKNEGINDWKEFKNLYGDDYKIIRFYKMKKIALKYPERIVSLNTLQKPSKEIQKIIEKSKIERNKFFVINRENADSIYVYNGRTLAFFKKKIRNIDGLSVPTDVMTNIWTDISYLSLGLEGGVDFPNSKKPERLIKRILEIATDEKDLVLDSFLGSGTTAAVAHKMGRRYIGIEMGNHAITHCVPRLKAVVDGEQGGISKAVNWQGGGGFRFYKLGDEVFDAEGCINEKISFENLSSHIWFTETKTPFNKPKSKSTYLGNYDGKDYALLYNGILKDKKVDGGNVLTNKTLNVILEDMGNKPYDKLIVYGESSRISETRLKSLNIEFKQTPYDIKAR